MERPVWRRPAVRILASLLVLAIVLGLGGCGGSDKPAGEPKKPAEEPKTPAVAPKVPQIAVYAYHSEPVIFWDPADVFSNEIIVMNNAYEQLIQFDPATKKFVPVLAENYQVSKDGLVWTFNLRKGVKFHCGEPMNAAAVKYSIDRTIQRGKGASFIWSQVKEIKTPDENTVEFHLKVPAPLDFIAAAGYSAFVYCPKHAKEFGTDWFGQGNTCGTGPYKVESWKRGDEVVMTRFNDYWRGWSGNHLDKAIIKMVPEPSTRRQMLESGQADYCNEMPFEDIGALANNPKIEILTTPSYQMLMALFNMDKPPLNNKLVRQAISYAIPYDDIVKHVFHGYATQSKGAVPQGLWGHDDSLPQYAYDLEKAKSLLAKAGYPNGGFKIVLTYVGGDEKERQVAELMKSELAKLNIQMDIRGMPWDAQWEMGKAKQPKDRQDIFLFYWWPDLADPYSFLNAVFHSEKEIVFNLSYYKSREFDRLIDEANSVAGADRAKAISLYSQAQKTLIEDAPAAWVADLQYVRPKIANLKGVRDNPAYPHVLFFYDAYRE
ncbi:MAG: ABC transporter substrate-binding protein [Firmicutes bacterium]|nr:ABC transporter substrate-binding protein [Bacillota bacterium]